MLKHKLRVEWRDENRKMNINDFFLSNWHVIVSIYDLYSYYVPLNSRLENDIRNLKISSYIFILSSVNCKNMLMLPDYLRTAKNCSGLAKFAEQKANQAIKSNGFWWNTATNHGHWRSWNAQIICNITVFLGWRLMLVSLIECIVSNIVKFVF